MEIRDDMLILEEIHCSEQQVCECCNTYLGESAWTEIYFHRLHPTYNNGSPLPSEVELKEDKLYFLDKAVKDYSAKEFSDRIPSQLVIRTYVDYWQFVCGFDLLSKGGYWLGLSDKTNYDSFKEIQTILNDKFGDNWEIFLEEPFSSNL